MKNYQMSYNYLHKFLLKFSTMLSLFDDISSFDVCIAGYYKIISLIKAEIKSPREYNSEGKQPL